MITRLLVANRGEIARRVFASCRALGIGTVAVFSDADEGAPHVAEADRAVRLPGLASAATYLNTDAIVAAALAAGADAVHPGYGFLSEDPGLARAVIGAGLTWVGPPPEAMAAMALKVRARQRAVGAGVPVLPELDPATVTRFPVLVKASAGGGGRGMRAVYDRAGLPTAIESARREAEAAFGDGTVFCEPLLTGARHIEVQVLADDAGTVWALTERDCSVQRRYAKVIEETPSPAVGPALRDRLAAAAAALARQVGYRSAGTVEFLVGAPGTDEAEEFYFLEFNTRLQVEHPVTELITGIDLVEWQLRIAQGEPLPQRQGEIPRHGHAIEVRLCAEEPADGFLPRAGTILLWEASPAARCDAALASGSLVSPHYDSMLGKVVAHGADRAQAIARLALALEETTLLGVATNRQFLIRLLRHPAFIAGDTVSTAFIPTHFPDDASRAVAPEDLAWGLAAWLAVVASPLAASWPEAWRGWSSTRPLSRPWRLACRAPVTLERSGQIEWERGRAVLRLEGREMVIAGSPAAAGEPGEVMIEETPLRYRFVWQDEALWLKCGGQDFLFAPLSRVSTARPAAGAAGDGVLRAPMSGQVVHALSIGEPVVRGQGVLALEAMKMEVTLPAPHDGILTSLTVGPGDQVVLGQILAVVEPAGVEPAEGAG